MTAITKYCIKLVSILLIFSLLVQPVFILNASEWIPEKEATPVEERPVSGYAGYSKLEKIVWNYDTNTKTLSFSGKGAIMSNEDGADIAETGDHDECSLNCIGTWYVWRDEVEHLVIGKGITQIGYCNFKYFTKLESVSFPDTLERIMTEAFANCGLKKITIPGNVKWIGSCVFKYSSLEDVTIEEGVKTIEYGAFANTNISTFKFPKSVKSLEVGVTCHCKELKKLILPPELITLPGSCFWGCTNLKSVILPQSIKKITDCAFGESSLQVVTLPKNVEVIGVRSNKTSSGVFESCNDLKKVIIKSKKLRKVNPGSFKNFPKKAVIIVPKGKKKSYAKMFYKAGLSKKVKIKEQ